MYYILILYSIILIDMPRQSSKTQRTTAKPKQPIKSYRTFSHDIHSGVKINKGEWLKDLTVNNDSTDYKGILEKHGFTTGILALNHIGPYGYDLEDTIKDTYNNLCSSSDKFIYCRGMYVKDGKNPTFVLHVTYAAKHYYINLLLPKGIRPILLKKQINREAFGELILLNNRIKIPAEPYIYTSTFSVCINCSAPKGHPHKFSCN